MKATVDQLIKRGISALQENKLREAEKFLKFCYKRSQRIRRLIIS